MMMDTTNYEKQDQVHLKSTWNWPRNTSITSQTTDGSPMDNLVKDSGLRYAYTNQSVKDWNDKVEFMQSSISAQQSSHPYARSEWAYPQAQASVSAQLRNRTTATITSQNHIPYTELSSDITNRSKCDRTTVLDTGTDRYSYLYSPITPSPNNVAASPVYNNFSASSQGLLSETSIGFTAESGASSSDIFNFEGLHSVAHESHPGDNFHNDGVHHGTRSSGGITSATPNTACSTANTSDRGRSVSFGSTSFTPRQVEVIRQTGNARSATARQSSFTSSGNQHNLSYNMPVSGQALSANPEWSNLGRSFSYHGVHFENPTSISQRSNLLHSLQIDDGKYACDSLQNTMMRPITQMSAASGIQRYSAPNVGITSSSLNGELIVSDVHNTGCERGCEQHLRTYVETFHRIGHSSNSSRVHLKDQNDFLAKLIFDQQGNFKYHLSCLTRIFKISRRRFRRVHSKCLKSVKGQQQVHGLKGRPSNNRKAAETRLQFVQFVKDMRVRFANDPDRYYLADNVSSIQGWFPSSLRMRFNDSQLKMLAKHEQEKVSPDTGIGSSETSMGLGSSNDSLANGPSDRKAQPATGHDKRPSFQTISNSTCQRWFKRFFSADTFIYAQHCRRASMEEDIMDDSE